MLFSVIGTWIVLLIVGWSTVLAAGRAVVDTAGSEAGFVATLSFVATSLVGGSPDDLRLAAGVWQHVRPLLLGSGFVLFSLVIAYVIPVVNATVSKRKVAAYVSTLGHEPAEILRRTWNGDDLADLHLHLIALAPMVRTAYIEPGDDHVPTPAITELRDLGIPIPDDRTLSEAFAHLETRRRTLYAFLQHMGWHWEDLATGGRWAGGCTPMPCQPGGP